MDKDIEELAKILGDLDFENQNFQSNGDQDPPACSYPCVTLSDVEPMSIISPDIENGPWIAGGAALRWYQGLSVGENDIDVFCANARQARLLIDRVKSYNRYHVKHESENAITIDYHRKDDWNVRWTIQIITRRYFSSLQEVIDNFDITVCQIGTCGHEWTMAPQTARDIRERNLRFTGDLRTESVKRLTKYWIYGYRPVPGTLDLILKNPDVKWQFSDLGDYENAF